jgi:comEA protein
MIRVKTKHNRPRFFRGGHEFSQVPRILTEPGDELPEGVQADLTEDQADDIRNETRFLEVKELSEADLEALPEAERKALAIRHMARQQGKTEDQVRVEIDRAQSEPDEFTPIPPDRGTASDDPSGNNASPAGEDPAVLDVNSATAEQLASVKGIGEELAEAIVAYREEHGDFDKLDDLVSVAGIGKASVKKLSDRLSV